MEKWWAEGGKTIELWWSEEDRYEVSDVNSFHHKLIRSHRIETAYHNTWQLYSCLQLNSNSGNKLRYEI